MHPIKFVQSWGGVEWISKQKYEDSDLENQIKNIYIPDKNVINALASMFNAYYPNDLLRINSGGNNDLEFNEKLPWEYHKELYAKEKTDSEKYKRLLTEILTNEWILSWHWRAVLPTLKNWDSTDRTKTTIIQISHFRKWEMLLCYSVDSKKLKNYESLKEIPLNEKVLLRAPLFGISHRLKGWDTYRLFYSDSIKKYIENKINYYSKSPKKNDFANILGRHDCYYIIDDVKPLENGYEWSLKCTIETEPEVLQNKLLKTKKLINPLDFIEIPTFGNEHDGIPQLLSSDNYCEAIYELMEILNDPTAKSVLLIAPPGSGKEKLAEFAFHCRENKKRGRYIATTFAGLTANEVSKLLFSVTSIDDFNGKTDLEKKDKLKTYESKEKDGLLLRALDGALFIDEIDKADKSVRNLLLRVLESGEITDPETSRIINIKKRMPLYIFSGSMSRKNMFQEPPPDFWTRISHIIEVSHPLAIDDIDKSKKVVKDYLWMFWTLHVKEFMNNQGLIADSENSLTKPLVNYNLQLLNFLLDERIINFVCEILSDEISGRGKPLVSIRTLRSIVARSLFKLLEVIQFSKFDNEPIEVYKWTNRDTFKSLTFDEWFEKILNIISIDLYEKRKDKKEICPIELGVLESFKSAIRLGTKLAQ